MKKTYRRRMRAAVMALCLTLGMGQVAYAETTAVEMTAAETSTAETTAVETTAAETVAAQNADIEQPVILSEGACLMDAATGKVLFGKNENKQFYPASITKVMTSLLTLEKCSLTDVVTFSKTATTNLEAGASGLGVSEGDQLTVEQALYGFLLKSANEIGNGLAEHISGSNAAFAELMNQRAAELGCQHTHFSNPHGLNDTTHLTTPYDMCLILREALKNPDFRRIDNTTSYEFPAIKKAEAHKITMGHKMMQKSDSRYYEGIIGGKTGYTSKAGNTLVTGAERNGVRLIAVVMKSQSTHYRDTKELLDYGFRNYKALTNVHSITVGAQTEAVGPGVTVKETAAQEAESQTVQETREVAENAADTEKTNENTVGIDQYTGARVELKAPGA